MKGGGEAPEEGGAACSMANAAFCCARMYVADDGGARWMETGIVPVFDQSLAKVLLLIDRCARHTQHLGPQSSKRSF